MTFAILHPPLIADPDPALLESLVEDTGATLAPPITVSTAKSMEDQLTHGRYVFSGIFANPQIFDGDVFRLICRIRRSRPSTPLFLFSRGISSQITPEDLRAMTVSAVIAGKISYPQILKLVTGAQISAEAMESERTSLAESAYSERIEIAQSEGEFLPVSSAQFLSGAASYFDVYIKLSTNRYIKILNKENPLGAERLSNYLKHGVGEFYIRQKSYGEFLSHCQTALSRLIETPNATVEIKAGATLEQGAQVMEFLKARRVNPTQLRYAQDFVNDVIRLTENLKLEEIPSLKKMLADPAYRSHATACAIIGALLGTRVGLKGEKAVSLIGIASFLHDIGLPSAESRYLEGDTARMTREERALYEEHPNRGAEMLKNAGLEPIAIQAIRQHHERRNGKGFPNQLGAGQINLISEVVGMSDELMHLIARSALDPSVDPYKQLENQAFDGFSTPVIEAFRKCYGTP